MCAMLSSFSFHYLAHLFAPAHMSVILTQYAACSDAKAYIMLTVSVHAAV